MIQIMKASAGSGKTYNLARKYIELLFRKKERYAYRHILAVTFTNKATDEMKTRIMHELFVLADNPGDSDYMDYFIPSVFPDEESLKKAADQILCDMLHDYSAFSVSTIDRFFQQTLKAFSREIGQFASYQVELDKDSLVAESVDRILDSLTEKDRDKLQWLTDSAMDRIEQGNRYALEADLVDMAKRLKSDEHRAAVEKAGAVESEAYSRANLDKMRKGCLSIIKDFESSLSLAARNVLQSVSDAGLEPEDFRNHFVSAVSRYADIRRGDVLKRPTDTFFRNSMDRDRWFVKSKSKAVRDASYPGIEISLQEFCSMFGAPYRLYRTATIIKAQLYNLGIASELYREFDALMKEKNVLSIDDSNTILKDIISGSDAPFIYEKTGVRYDNFLLDEFQDTSRIQWDNFLPLLKESVSKGCECLVVGDVKQSIYRWRGSDWNLLGKELQQVMPETEVSTLDTNFRSCRTIVDFNNRFFRSVAEDLDRIYGEVSGCRDFHEISQIYSDVVQKCRSEESGIVSITFCDKEMELQKVLDAIMEARAGGASLKDMAILVRNNISGARIAEFLIAEGIKVVTDDTLKIKSSAAVRRLVSMLSYMDNPADSISGYMVSSMQVAFPDEYHSLTGLCEYLLREMQKEDAGMIDAEILYIQSFLDQVSDYSRINGNGLRGFLKYWDSADPAIASPDAGDSVRIMTVHKSKGLDFGYVIFPFVEDVTLYKHGRHWCSPDFSGTPLGDAARSVYDVVLSSESTDTMFADDYLDELQKQYVDNINVMYVALTRARKGMHIIGELPSDKFRESVESGMTGKFSDFSQALFSHAAGLGLERNEEEDGAIRFTAGQMPDNWTGKRDNAASDIWKMSFKSWPLNSATGKQRLVVSRSLYDFFSEDGEAGVKASSRIRGIVLHEILSGIRVLEDLDMAVKKAVMDGNIDSEAAREARELLNGRIRSAIGRGWFSPGNRIYNEADIIGSDGMLHRPDRVEITPDNQVRIVDYKFGRSEESHKVQVSEYADLYRKMGYSEVYAAVWYVIPDEEISVCRL